MCLQAEQRAVKDDRVRTVPSLLSAVAYADPCPWNRTADGLGESPSQLCGIRGCCDVVRNLFLPVGSDTLNITLCFL